MKNQNKYRYLVVLQGNYGYGWDDLCHYDKSDLKAYKEAKTNLKCYRYNEKQALHRIIERRELNN